MVRRFACGGALAVAVCAGYGLAAPVELVFARPDASNAAARSRCILDTQPVFRFVPAARGDAGIAGSITDIYFQNGRLLDPTSGAPVFDFSLANAAPARLPDSESASRPVVGMTPITADAARCAVNGIATDSDWLQARPRPFADVRSAIESGALGPDLHVRALGAVGHSESLVNGPSVPLPSALWMGLSGVATLGLAALLRRRAR